MAITLPQLLEMFKGFQAVLKKQQDVLIKLKGGQIDEAVHEVYNKDSLKKFIEDSLIPRGGKVSDIVNDVKKMDSSLQKSIISMISQDFPKDFQAKILNMSEVTQGVLIEGASEFAGCKVELEDGKLKASTLSTPSQQKKLDMLQDLLNKSGAINAKQEMNKSISDEIYKQTENIEGWLNNHVLISPSSSEGYTIEGF